MLDDESRIPPHGEIGATRVEVRAKTLGNLNFNKVKLEANEDTIVLKGSRI